MKYSLGLLPEKDDHRDLLMAGLMPEITLPIKRDCREFMGAIRSQGQEGICGGMAAAGMKEWQEHAEYLEFIQLSPRYVYEKSREVESVHGEGTTLRALCKALHQYGICEEKFWPYKSGHKGTPKPGTEENARQYRIIAYAKLNTIDEIMLSLMVNGPGMIGLYVTPNWYKVPADGIMKPIRKNAHRYGGHALVFCGFDRKKKKLLIRNSWGLGWGKAGYAWVDFKSIENQMISAWSATDLITGE